MGIKTYLVGGAVRDQLLGKRVKERDFVVVGSAPEIMVKKGFRPIGKDFPVFLHPKTHDEYALARTERKIAKGYKGFKIYASPEVTLEEDLKRRDLTINAMAKTREGKIIDPFLGRRDLKRKILRHVSPAFAEDPVRILRVARFAAKLGDFKVAPETNKLMQKMVRKGEVDALVPERVWQEISRALQEKFPSRFFEVLKDCGALKIILPEIDRLFGVPNPKHWHPEIDTGIHTLMALQAAVKLTKDPMIRFAVLTHDLGKGSTPKSFWPKHPDHANRSVPLIQTIAKRLRLPKDYAELALLVGRYHNACADIKDFGPKGILKLLLHLDAFRRPERFQKFLIACKADARGRTGFERCQFPQKKFLEKIYRAAASVNTRALAENTTKEKIANKIYEARLNKIKSALAPR